MSSRRKKIAITGLAVGIGFWAFSGTSLSWAGDLTTSDEILHALSPEPIVTRSLTGQHSSTPQPTGQVKSARESAQ